MSNTKDRENKGTLMHFLVELVERDHPDLLHLPDELIHLDTASRVSTEAIQKVLKQMDSSIKNLEMDLKNASRSANDPDDRSVKVARNGSSFEIHYYQRVFGLMIINSHTFIMLGIKMYKVVRIELY